MSGIGEFFVIHENTIWDGLIDYSRTQSMFDLVGSSSFDMVLGYRGLTYNTFKPNKKIYTYYKSPENKDFLISVGFVDSVSISNDGSTVVKISVRDESSLLVDCSWINENEINGQYDNVGLEYLLNSIIGRYVDYSQLLVKTEGVRGVFVNMPDRLLFEKTSYSIDNNSTPFDSVKALGDKFNFLMYCKFVEDSRVSNRVGRYSVFQLIDTFDDLDQTGIVLKKGVNITKYEYNSNFAKVFSEYNAKGQGSISDTEHVSNSTAISYKKVVSDEFYRPTSVNSSDGVNEDEIKKLCNRRILADGISANILKLDVVFDYLTKNDNRVMSIGQVVGVVIDELDINEYHVITEISYNLNSATIGTIPAREFSELLK